MIKIYIQYSEFRASPSCSKILNVKGIFNTVKIFRATLFFRASVLFVTSQFDVIVMFPNQSFGEVC